jgi:type I restriction enzyme R subunit
MHYSKDEDDPEYDKLKAQKKLKHYVESHEHAIKESHFNY